MMEAAILGLWPSDKTLSSSVCRYEDRLSSSLGQKTQDGVAGSSSVFVVFVPLY